MAEADIFIFLDDVQFSKGSYTNRVSIRAEGGRRWLTVPVKVTLGQSINEVTAAKENWVDGHLETLKHKYKECAYFKRVWPDIEGAYGTLKTDNLSEINLHLIEKTARRLGLSVQTHLASSLNAVGKSDDLLISLLEAVSPGCVYLSGEGGGKYQSDEKFRANGFDVRYLAFQHPVYAQHPTAEPFEAGLSVLDAVFNLGWDQTADLLRSAGSQ